MAHDIGEKVVMSSGAKSLPSILEGLKQDEANGGSAPSYQELILLPDADSRMMYRDGKGFVIVGGGPGVAGGYAVAEENGIITL